MERERRTDRRTFLANTLRTGAAVTLSGAVIEATGTGSSGASGASSASGAASTGPSAPLKAPLHLCVNGNADAIGVDPEDVSFSWQLDDLRKGAAQSAYRIRVWKAPTHGQSPSTPGDIPDPIWDSGVMRTSQQAFVSFNGRQSNMFAPNSLASASVPSGTSLELDTEYLWSVSVQDQHKKQGPWAQPSSFVTGPGSDDWTAQWLRPGPAGTYPEEYSYLRTVVHPSASPIVRATGYVAAAHKYQLWCNGQKRDTGPCFSFPDESYFQATDLTGTIEAGKPNAIGILHHWYGIGNGRPPSIPGVIVQLTIVHRDGTREVFGTDGSWRERTAEWLPAPARNTEAHDFVEIIDGRSTPVGWADPSYDDTTWHAATVLGPVGTTPFTRLFAQRTRIQEQKVTPASVRTLTTGAVIVDFGHIHAGRPIVTFHKGVAGRTINMHVGYLLDSDGQVSTSHGTQGTDLSFTYIERDGAQQFDPYTFLGYRYLQIDAPGEHIASNQVASMARHTAMPEVPMATFTSNNAMLDKVWALCMHSSVFACHEQFVDTPTRQKGQFTQDSTNESQAIMRAYGDQNQSWQGLRDFARSQERYWPTAGRVSEIYPTGTGSTDVPDFTETYVEWLWRYYEQTGDRATLAQLFPVVQNIAAYVSGAIDPTTGLVTELPGGGTSTYEYGIIDWPPQMRYGYDMATTARTVVNTLGANVFRRASQMAEILGTHVNAAAYVATQLALTTAINARLVRGDGVYIDGLEADGSQSTHASQQANALALTYDLVPTDRITTVGTYALSLGIAVGPDHGLELLRGLNSAGQGDGIVKLLTDPDGPGYAHIVANGGTFTWESWTPSDLEQDSLSHGWGSGALAGMYESLLGISLATAPGATEDTPVGALLAVQAPPGSLSSVTGTFPTIAGTVGAKWSRSNKGLGLELTIPANARATVTLPSSSNAGVTESGRPLEHTPTIRVVARTTHALQLSVGAGTYEFFSTL